ncbi:MAG: hypothetical protein R3E83_15155 [Burkholderiaceae bacterium]
MNRFFRSLLCVAVAVILPACVVVPAGTVYSDSPDYRPEPPPAGSVTVLPPPVWAVPPYPPYPVGPAPVFVPGYRSHDHRHPPRGRFDDYRRPPVGQPSAEGRDRPRRDPPVAESPRPVPRPTVPQGRQIDPGSPELAPRPRPDSERFGPGNGMNNIGN